EGLEHLARGGLEGAEAVGDEVGEARGRLGAAFVEEADDLVDIEGGDAALGDVLEGEPLGGGAVAQDAAEDGRGQAAQGARGGLGGPAGVEVGRVGGEGGDGPGVAIGVEGAVEGGEAGAVDALEVFDGEDDAGAAGAHGGALEGPAEGGVDVVAALAGGDGAL